MASRVALGEIVRDPLTGFEGIVVARTEWLYGCIRLGVQSKAFHEGKPVEPHWIDEGQVVIVAAARDKRAKTLATGGPPRESGKSFRIRAFREGGR